MPCNSLVEKVGVYFQIGPSGLEVVITEYRVRPVLLTHRDLAELGLRFDRGAARPESMVKRQEARGGWPGQFEVGPAIAAPEWRPCPGQYFGDVYLAPSREGLEVHIDDSKAEDQVVPWAGLNALGLHALPQAVQLEVV